MAFITRKETGAGVQEESHSPQPPPREQHDFKEQEQIEIVKPAETLFEKPPEPMQATTSSSWILEFQAAKQYLNNNDLKNAVPIINNLIKSGNGLDEIIREINLHTSGNPSDATLWQLIGDAYARKNDLQSALESYNKAEDLLK